MYRVSSFKLSKSTQHPLFYRFLEMENKFCCIRVTTVWLLPLSVQYPDSVSCLRPLALTSTNGIWMIKVLLLCCLSSIIYCTFNYNFYASCPLSLISACICPARYDIQVCMCLHVQVRHITFKGSDVLLTH